MLQVETSDALKRLPEQFFAKLTGKVAKLKAQGHDIINLGQGNPDRPTPPHIVEALREAAGNPVNHRYPPFRGHLYLKRAVADFYERHYGVELDPEKEVAILIGGKSGLVEVSQCLLNPGDSVLVPDPGYPDYWSGVAMAGASMHMMPLLAENGFLPDYARIPSQVLDQTKLMFINYPNNPTGAVATPDFFEQTVAFAEEHGIAVVHDFAYGGIGFDGHQPPSFLQTRGAKNTGIEIYTLSKTYNMAGWRVAFAIGHEQMISSINLIQDHFHCSMFGGIQEAARAALSGPQISVRELVEMYDARRQALIGGLREIGWRVDFPRGSFFTWLRVPKGCTSEEWADLLLEQARVVMAPGEGFGRHGEGYVRAGLIEPEERLKEAVERIGKLGLFQNTGKFT